MDDIKLEKLGAFILEDTNSMNIINGVQHLDNNSDTLPNVRHDSSSNDLLDYITIVVARELGGLAAFKGGYMLNKLLKGDSRMTHDVDFSVKSYETYEELKRLLSNIAEKFKQAGLISDYHVKENISPTMSGGIDMYGSNGTKALGVDIGLHDIGWGVTDYTLDIAKVKGFEIERMLADKIIAILSRKRFRRAKDLYDFWAITNIFDFDFQKLIGYIERRGNAEWDNLPFSNEVLVQYERAWNKLVLVAPTGDTLSKPIFKEVVSKFSHIAEDLMNRRGFKKWDCKSQTLM